MKYHEPVLPHDAVDAMGIVPGGVYVDATYGGGGHAALILERLDSTGRLIAFDQDEDAKANIIADERLIFVPHNFRFLKKFLRLYGFNKIDGLLADLGVSSHQLDAAERGFSYRFEADIDMRMNRSEGITAGDILNTWPAEKLQTMLSAYGEVRNAKTLAQAIVKQQSSGGFKTTRDLIQVAQMLSTGPLNKYLSQVFQALRMEVNEETEVLKDLLSQSAEVLNPGGRLVVIAYHSIEDRLVKNFVKSGNFDGADTRDIYGNFYKPFRSIQNKPIAPTDEEISRNPRARSAKMRIAERLEE